MSRTSGKASCPCLSRAEVYESVSNCDFSATKEGFAPCDRDSCFPLDFGTGFCTHWELEYDASCLAGGDIPDYCLDQWCYVDYDKCKLSSERMTLSRLHPELTNLYFSYSTCYSDDSAFQEFIDNRAILARTNLTVSIPENLFPGHYKLNEYGKVSPGGPEEHDVSVPFQGYMIDYFDAILKNADMVKTANYRTRTRGSDTVFNSSSWMAAVRDVQVGVSDLALGVFWMTTERLYMTSFTAPIATDRVLLAVRKPLEKNSILFELQKLKNPLTTNLWLLLLVAIIVVVILSIWFSSEDAENSRPWHAFRNKKWKRASPKERIYITVNTVFESFLEVATDFCGAAVGHDWQATLQYKILMFGFALFIMIFVSAYVANLAAFLTQSSTSSYIRSVPDAIAKKATICSFNGIRDELTGTWGRAKFKFTESFYSPQELMDLWDSGICDVLAINEMDGKSDINFIRMLNERDIVLTSSMIIDIPIAFPVKKDLARQISYWLYRGEKESNIRFMQFWNANNPTDEQVRYYQMSELESNELAPITIQNMLLPYIVLFLCIIGGIVIKLRRKEDGDTEVTDEMSENTYDDVHIAQPLGAEKHNGDRSSSTKANVIAVPVVVDKYGENFEHTFKKSIFEAIEKHKAD